MGQFQLAFAMGCVCYCYLLFGIFSVLVGGLTSRFCYVARPCSQAFSEEDLQLAELWVEWSRQRLATYGRNNAFISWYCHSVSHFGAYYCLFRFCYFGGLWLAHYYLPTLLCSRSYLFGFRNGELATDYLAQSM